MNERTSSPIVATAGLAVAMLLSAVGWQLGGYYSSHRAQTTEDQLAFQRAAEETLRPKITNTAWREELAALGIIATSTPAEETATSSRADPLATLDDSIAQEFLYRYLSLKQSGIYSPEKGAALGAALGANIRAPLGYSLHGEGELSLDADISLTRVLRYRADMRDALAILISDAPPEFEVFAHFIETKDPERLRELSEAVERYRTAEAATLAVVVPQDAAALHVRVVNALGSYAHALDQLIRSADSPFTSLVILRTYNEAEREMLYAFDALSGYYVRKSSE